LIKRGENADFFSSARGYSETQLEEVRSEIQLVYEDFVKTVADSRGMTYDQVDRAAQGRVWSGTRAIDYHLVDQIGGISDAIDWACRRVHVKRSDAEIDIIPTREQSILPNLRPLTMAAELIEYLADPSEYEIPTDISMQLGAGLYFKSPYDLTIR
jgi:protease-4